eukprot:scaffold92606_cov29-Tisochrysis_lutea.AAC.2
MISAATPLSILGGGGRELPKVANRPLFWPHRSATAPSYHGDAHEATTAALTGAGWGLPLRGGQGEEGLVREMGWPRQARTGESGEPVGRGMGQHGAWQAVLLEKPSGMLQESW